MSGLLIHSGRRFYSRLPIHIFPCLWADASRSRYFFSTESEEAQSARSAFKLTPVHPSVLKYVQRVGVGKPERKRRSKTKSQFLTQSEEKDQLGRSRKPLPTNPPPPFPSSNVSSSSEKKIRRSPVKLLKRVGSLADEFPKPSPTMPEVVRSWETGKMSCISKYD